MGSSPKSWFPLLLTFLAASAPAGVAMADPVPQLSLGGFEEPDVAEYRFGLAGWKTEVAAGANRSVGVFGPRRACLPKSLPEGTHCAFLFGDPSLAWARISQSLGVVRAGRTYRIDLRLGRQAAGGDGRSNTPSYKLFIRNAQDGSEVARAVDPVAPKPGEFVACSLVYTPTKSHAAEFGIEATGSKTATVLLVDAVSLHLVVDPARLAEEGKMIAIFDQKVSPILQSRCGKCHGDQKQKGGLRLDSLGALLQGGDSGDAIVAGDPKASLLIQRLRSSDVSERMPAEADPLPRGEIESIANWIKSETLTPDNPLLPASPGARPADLDPSFRGPLAANSEAHLIARRRARLAQAPAPPGLPAMEGPIKNEIDRFIVAAWRKAPAAPCEPRLCDDATFLRRVYLDLIGAAPTVAEAREFLADKSPEKRSHLIDRLLARNIDYAAHWTPFWLDALGSSKNATFGGVVTRGDYLPWIVESFRRNKAYDVFAAEVIDPTMPGFKQPEFIEILGIRYKVSFLRAADHKESLQTAADVGQLFLGTGMKCASCHSHFENHEWPQQRFLAFAGYFAAQDLEQIRCEKSSGRTIPTAWPFAVPGIPKWAPAEAAERLHLAAQLLTDPLNPRFAKTIVNRLWKRYLGLGLFEPVDDFRLDTPPSHPELLEWLAYDFMAHDYDLKHTIRLILNSRTYQLAYDAKLADHFDIQKPRESSRWFRSPSLRRLTAEQIIDSISVVRSQRLDDAERCYRALENVPSALGEALGRSDIRSETSTARTGDPSIVQALEFLNGEKFNGMIDPAPLLASISDRNDARAIAQALYLAALSRAPSEAEARLAEEFLTGGTGKGSRVSDEAISDMLWSLFTSPLFQYLR